MVDVSVLTPVLNEEEHIREVAAKMLAQRFDGTIEFLFIDGDSEDRTVEILRELQRRTSACASSSNPRRSTPVALNIGLANARGAFIARMDAHTLYPEDYLARGVARLRRGGADHVSGPQLAHGDGHLVAPGGAGARHARWAVAGRSSGTRLERRDRGRQRLHRRLAARGAGGARRLGRGLAQRPGLRAGRARSAAAAAASCACRRWARGTSRATASRALARQYWRYGVYRAKTSGAHPESMRRSHLLAPSLALSLAAAILPLGGVRALGRAAVALWCAAVVGVATAEAWRADSALELDASAADVAALPAVFGAMHLAWGFGFLFGCVRFGPPLRALAHLARRAGRERSAAAARRRLRGQLVQAHRGRRLRRPLAGRVHRRRRRCGRAHDPARPARPRAAARPLPRAGPRRVRRPALLPEHAQPGRAARDAALAARVLAAAVRRSTSSGCSAPHPLCLAFAALAALRRKRITLGRAPGLPDLRAHAPPRPPRSCTSPATCSRAPTGCSRAARPTVVVGPDLARNYSRAPPPAADLGVARARLRHRRPGRGGRPALGRRADGAERRPARDREEPAAARRRARRSSTRTAPTGAS